MEGLDKPHGGSKHILTIEDPPEYRIRGEGINQTPLVMTPLTQTQNARPGPQASPTACAWIRTT